jgi:hypothetical protein
MGGRGSGCGTGAYALLGRAGSTLPPVTLPRLSQLLRADSRAAHSVYSLSAWASSATSRPQVGAADRIRFMREPDGLLLLSSFASRGGGRVEGGSGNHPALTAPRV